MTPEEVREEAVRLMEAAGKLTIRLSENEEVYDLQYIAFQLAKCSSYGERLADMMARLAKLKVVTLLRLDRAENALEIAQVELELSPEAEDWKPAARRTAWIFQKTEVKEDERRAWKLTDQIIREAKEDVSRRADIVKRIDSDLRLHQRILEAKITAGAMGLGDLIGKPGHRGAERDVIPGTADGDGGVDMELD